MRYEGRERRGGSMVLTRERQAAVMFARCRDNRAWRHELAGQGAVACRTTSAAGGDGDGQECWTWPGRASTVEQGQWTRQEPGVWPWAQGQHSPAWVSSAKLATDADASFDDVSKGVVRRDGAYLSRSGSVGGPTTSTAGMGKHRGDQAVAADEASAVVTRLWWLREGLPPTGPLRRPGLSQRRHSGNSVRPQSCVWPQFDPAALYLAVLSSRPQAHTRFNALVAPTHAQVQNSLHAHCPGTTRTHTTAACCLLNLLFYTTPASTPTAMQGKFTYMELAFPQEYYTVNQATKKLYGGTGILRSGKTACPNLQRLYSFADGQLCDEGRRADSALGVAYSRRGCVCSSVGVLRWTGCPKGLGVTREVGCWSPNSGTRSTQWMEHSPGIVTECDTVVDMSDAMSLCGQGSSLEAWCSGLSTISVTSGMCAGVIATAESAKEVVAAGAGSTGCEEDQTVGCGGWREVELVRGLLILVHKPNLELIPSLRQERPQIQI
ncbi:hypothetical protein BDV93DRAFT_512066 [Ceratobasidium sp. AG-I]|nr:hypothetical protein BDV93DRAFT_512066 [Ceratobasidium sp. AG-I]